MDALSFIITILSSGGISAIVTLVIQKNNEKESRLFNAKMEAYKNFIGHLQSFYTEFWDEEKVSTSYYLDKISSLVILLGSEEIVEKLKQLNIFIASANSKWKTGKKDESKEFVKANVHPLKLEIEKLMREDLGLQKMGKIMQKPNKKIIEK